MWLLIEIPSIFCPFTSHPPAFNAATECLASMWRNYGLYRAFTGRGGEKGIYVRDYDREKTYQLQAMRAGIRYTDTLGSITLEEARIIRDQLTYNRKNGTGPQTFAEMEREKAAIAAAETIRQEQERNEILKTEQKRRDNTVSKFWENRFWPRRLSLKRSVRETASMDGRWRNFLKPFFGEMALANLEKQHFLDFVAKMRSMKNSKSETTIHKCIADMRQLWALALEEEIVSKIFPGKFVAREVLSEIDNEKKCYLEPDEAKLLIQTVWDRRLNSRLDHDVYAYVMLGLGLGLRAGDIHKLNQQIVETQIIPRTKNKRSRFAHFGFAPVRAMLEERLSLYPPSSPTEPLFCSQQREVKGKMRTEVPGKYFDIVKELGFNEVPKRKGNPLQTIDFHALRHTFATLAAMRGVDHVTLARLMGLDILPALKREDSHLLQSLRTATIGGFLLQRGRLSPFRSTG